MKKMLALAAALVVLAYAGMAFARIQAADSNKPAPVPAATTVPAAHSAKSATMAHSKSASAPHAMMLSGKIISVDAVANTLVIKGKKGDVTLNVDPAAKIQVGKESKLADLKTGTPIKVSFRMEGEQRVATKIW